MVFRKKASKSVTPTLGATMTEQGTRVGDGVWGKHIPHGGLRGKRQAGCVPESSKKRDEQIPRLWDRRTW
jgi:hypothetical protein